MFRKMPIFALTLLSFSFLIMHDVDVAGSTHNGEPVGNQLQNFYIIFEAERWLRVTDLNETIQLGIWSAILIAGIITLAITDRQISRMTKP